MICKPSYNEDFGTFCQFLIYNNECGGCEMGPDYIRLKNRFEVTNGAHEANSENMQMRSMSYAMTLGDTPEIKQIIKEQQWPIEPFSWYNQSLAIKASATKYNVSIYQVIKHY